MAIYSVMVRAHKHLTRIYTNILNKIEYESLLDVGCGPGLNLPMLTKGKNVNKIAGIDISDKAINAANEKYKGQFTVLDIQEERLYEKFDLVFCSLVLEHVPDDDKAMKNLHEMTGKYLLISTLAGYFERYRSYEEKLGHVRNYSPAELKTKLIKAGFTIIEHIQWGFPFYSPMARRVQMIKPHIVTGKFGKSMKIMAALLERIYFLNSSRKGDLQVILARV